MNKRSYKTIYRFIFLLILILSMGITVCAESDEEDTNVEQMSFEEIEGAQYEIDENDRYVDGLYNVNGNARASMTGVIRLVKSGTKLVANYSTDYTHSVDKIGLKNIKLDYKGSLGIWHNIITLDNRYSTNVSAYQGAFSCTGVIGRTYRLKATHYIIDGSYTETRNNVTENFTF